MFERLFKVIIVMAVAAGAARAADNCCKGKHAQTPAAATEKCPHEANAQMGGHKGTIVLPEGNYAADVKSLVCEGCAPAIEKTLLGIPGIQSTSVDQLGGVVHFSVKPRASVKWATIQQSLKNSSKQMGMGADFTLSNFRIDVPAPRGSKG